MPRVRTDRIRAIMNLSKEPVVMPDYPDIQDIAIQPEERDALVGGSQLIPGSCEEMVLFPQYTDQYPIYINMLVWRQLWQYACDNKDREIGGVLLGNVLNNEQGAGLDIQAYLPGRYMEETLASLTFNHRTWNDIHQRHSREHSDKKIIGWFHTHPGHGVFLSRYDLYIHQNFFPREGQIAVVFDPIHSSAGFFQRQDFQIRQLRRIHIYTRAGDDFDQNTRSFIATVGKHSQPECQPTLAMPIQINIPSGLSWEAKHQGLAFLLRLMDIRKKDNRELTPEELTLSFIAAPPEIEGDSVFGSSVPHSSELYSTSAPVESANRAQDDGSVAIDGISSFSYISTQSAAAEHISQQDEGLGLSSRVWVSHPSGAGEMHSPSEPEGLPAGIESYIYTPSLPLETDIISGQDKSQPLSAKRTGSASFLRMTREVDEQRLDMVKKKLIPIKDQVARDLRQAEREILSPTGYKQAEYSSKKPYDSDFDAESLNLML